VLTFHNRFATRLLKAEREAAASGGSRAAAGAPRMPFSGPSQVGRSNGKGGYRPMAQPDSPANQEAHWKKTTNLMLTHLGIWFFFGYIIHMFVNPLNKIVIPILGFPLGFYMAAQGSLIVFVVQLFLFAKQQNRIDREFGYAEED
jgi:putative solute:sodium symporter small subunit